MTDAQRTLGEQVQYAQTGGVAQALVDPNQLHAGLRAYDSTCFKRNIHL